MITSTVWRDRWVRWTHWEFWPAWLFNIPVVLIALWYGLRSGHLLFFTRCNPVIETGGLFGESKSNIYAHLPAEVVPQTILILQGHRDMDQIRTRIREAGLTYPVIAKPDVGERGYLVQPCPDEAALLAWLGAHPGVDFLVQEYVSYPEEYSVMYHRFPGADTGCITSLCAKRFLRVIGDGVQTVDVLMAVDPRASFQRRRLQQEQPELLGRVPSSGEEVLLEPVGNHCRGTAFLDANDRITPALTAVFDRISRASTGLYYGRFDLRCRNLNDLEQGVHFAILEYNGVAAEPAHIYQPGRSLGRAYRDMATHWGIIYRIAKAQRQRGVSTESWRDFWRAWRRWRR